MAESMQRRVTGHAEAEGIRIDWTRALIANTERAHRLVRLATLEYDAATQRALVEALFRFHFAEGGDVGDVQQLASVAESAGMDRDRAAEWLTSEEGERDVREALRSARGVGVQSVPTFVFDGQYGIEGAQSVEAFIEAMAEVRVRTGAGVAPREG
jgi:predicted DsbA family dithiol-disulfide isomerase